MKAAMLFANSLKDIIRLSSELSKATAGAKIEVLSTV